MTTSQGARCVLLTICVAAARTVCAADDPPQLRLSEKQAVAPTGYRVELTLDPAKDTFSGSIRIHLDVRQPFKTLWLNQNKITGVSASLKYGDRTAPATIVPGGNDFVGFEFPSSVPAGSAELSISYSGVIVTNNTVAVFRRMDGDNAYLFTQFEAIDARAAFPCFDEPVYKTPWQLTLHIPRSLAAISNTAAASEGGDGAMKTIVFRETKPLPSYLVAFAVGPFEFVDAGKAGRNQVPVRIVVPKGHAREAKYAAEVTGDIIARHERYFGIAYPYDKADQVAVPEFPGAMENPGMVTYGQAFMLSNPETDTIARKRIYYVVAAHELAHQWFGDLVTTGWWNDIWLNEAFASWMEKKLAAEAKPEWNAKVTAAADKLAAERSDSLVSARSVRQPIASNDDINNAFDGITYEKGAAVIAMFEHWIGRGAFQKGVQAYMNKYAFQATTSQQFLESISAAANTDVAGPVSTFLDQPGVPLVSVRLTCQSGSSPTLHLEQQRFLPLGSKAPAEQLWQIPVCVRYGTSGTGKDECTLLTSHAADSRLNSPACPAWVEANADAFGFYRVDYDRDLLHALSAGDVEHRLTAPERVDFMGNALALSIAGKLSASDALELIARFHADPERQVVEAALDLALTFRTHLVPDEVQPNFRRFLRENFQARARELGWVPRPGESDDIRLLRPRLVRAIATWGGDVELAKAATELTERWFADHRAIDREMTPAVLGAAAFSGDKALFDRLLAAFRQTQDKALRQDILVAMSSFRDPAAVRAGMESLLSGDIPFTEGPVLLFSGQGDSGTRRLAFDFLKAHFDQVLTAMPSGGTFGVGGFLPHVGDEFCDEESRSDLQAFFQPRLDKLPGAPRTLAQVVERIDQCIASTAAQQQNVVAFFQRK